MANFRVWTEQRDHRRILDVVILVQHEDGRESLAEPLVFRDLAENEIIERPTISRTSRGLDGRSFLQACLDRAWDIGMRPAGFADTTNQVQAIKAHLHDMRALVFKGKVAPKAGE